MAAIRRAARVDGAALAHFAERTFRETFADSNNASDMDLYCAQAFSPTVQTAEIDDPSLDTLLMEDAGGGLCGYAQLRSGHAPAEVTGPYPIELARLYIARDHHGRGAAQALIDAAFEAAQARGAETMWLGVWERNPRARTFYRKMGFRDVGTHEFLLGTDRQTDVVMTRSLLGSRGFEQPA